MRAEPEIKSDPVKLPGLLDQFCLKAAPEIWANAWPEAHGGSPPPAADRQRVLQESDCCLPLPWVKQPTLLAYSRTGCVGMGWQLPGDWRQVKTVQITNITVDRLTPAGAAEIKEGKLALTLTAGQAVRIAPK
jgi:hypothetical protein